MRTNLSLFGAVALALGLSASAHAQQTAYAIANGGSTLIKFDTSNPGAAVAVGNFNGGATFLDGIDFRPLNGQLYGYLDSSDTLYAVDLNTATLTAVASGAGPSATNTNLLGMDFNPTIDRVRVVTDSTQNLVYNPNSNAAPTVATSLFYGAGDVNANSNALIIDNAYTNNIAGLFGTSTQYGIDYGLGTLVTIANNAGTLGTVGSLGIGLNGNSFVGFDIFTNFTGINSAYALLDTTAGFAPGFYTVNLNTGTATSVGSVGGFTQVYSLAVAPAQAPEPASLALLGLGGLSAFVVRRRKTSAR
jgi:hypothetical protein